MGYDDQRMWYLREEYERMLDEGNEAGLILLHEKFDGDPDSEAVFAAVDAERGRDGVNREDQQPVGNRVSGPV